MLCHTDDRNMLTPTLYIACNCHRIICERSHAKRFWHSRIIEWLCSRSHTLLNMPSMLFAAIVHNLCRRKQLQEAFLKTHLFAAEINQTQVRSLKCVNNHSARRACLPPALKQTESPVPSRNLQTIRATYKHLFGTATALGPASDVSLITPACKLLWAAYQSRLDGVHDLGWVAARNTLCVRVICCVR